MTTSPSPSTTPSMSTTLSSPPPLPSPSILPTLRSLLSNGGSGNVDGSVGVGVTGCARSVVILTSFFIAQFQHHLQQQQQQQQTFSTSHQQLYIELLTLYGDALYACGEQERARYYYQMALDRASSWSISTLVGSHMPSVSAGSTRTIHSPMDTLRLRILMSQLSCESQHSAALSTYQSLSHDIIPLSAHLTCARIYLSRQQTRQASTCYTRVLRMQPLCVEAVKAVTRMGEVDMWIPTYGMDPSFPFLSSYISILTLQSQHQHTQALNLCQSLLHYYPECTELLIQQARCNLQVSDGDAAIPLLQRALAVDPHQAEGGDLLALLYRSRSDNSSLATLVLTLQQASQTRPEPWIAAALYSDALGQRDKALSLISSASLTMLSSCHPPVYLAHGLIALNAEQPEMALMAYKRANQLEPADLNAYQGTISVFVSSGQSRHAMPAAKAAYNLNPRNPKALVLIGTVLAQSLNRDARQKAAKAFNKAILVDPGCVTAVLELASMFAASKQYAEAIALLQQHVTRHHTDRMHTRLGQLYSLLGDTSHALHHFHMALSLTPDYRDAIEGIDKLEQHAKNPLGGDRVDSASDEYGAGGTGTAASTAASGAADDDDAT